MRYVFSFLGVFLALSFSFAGESINDLKGTALQQHLSADLKAIQVYRNGLVSTLSFVGSRKDLFPSTKLEDARILTREDKEAVRATWKTFLDYALALDSIGKFTADFVLVRGDARDQAFLAHNGSFLAVYRAALEFIDVVERDPGLRTLLNDPVPELGLEKGTYDQLKLRFLNVHRAEEFSAMHVYFKTVSCSGNEATCDAIRSDSDFIWNMGRGKGELLTAKAALQLLQKAGFKAYFPVQAGVAEWMGDEKVHRKDLSLITQQQIEEARARLEPGDIIFARREWYLSNIGLPGFWPHGALYIGTPEERARYFDDPGVKQWLTSQGWTESGYEELLKARNQQAYAISLKPQMGHPIRVLEAMSEGVSFTALEHCMDADSAAVVRPKLSKREKAIALMRAFHYAGRPYDFNFDFLTDSEIVCTELIYKAYEPATSFHGLTFQLLDILGRKATPANEMVREFDEQFGTPQQQTDFVLFLDGHEGAKKAIESTLEQFRQSWKRPKWFIVTQMK